MTKQTPQPKEFTTASERVFIEYITQSEDLAKLVEPQLRVEDYSDADNKIIVSFIKDYMAHYQVPPDKHQISASTGKAMNVIGAPGLTIGKDDATRHRNIAWFVKEYGEFIRNRAMGDAIWDASKAHQAGNYDIILSDMEKASRRTLIQKKTGLNAGADLKQITDIMVSRSLNMIKTGWPQLDAALGGGLPFGTLTMWAGRSGAGKSMTLGNLCVVLARNGYKVLYITAEMEDSEIQLRNLWMATGMKTMGDDITQEHADAVFAKASQIAYLNNITAEYLPEGSRPADIQAIIRSNENCDVVIVDYLDLIFPNDRSLGQENKHLADSMMTGEVRNIAKTENVVLITASQMVKGVKDRRPGEAYQLEDISGGTPKCQKCDAVIVLERHTNKEECEANHDIKPRTLGYKFFVAKARNGPTPGHFIPYRWNIKRLAIEEVGHWDEVVHEDESVPSPEKATEPLIAPEEPQTKDEQAELLMKLVRKSQIGEK